jgi:ABC-type sulfate transport system substrate-binding protein
MPTVTRRALLAGMTTLPAAAPAAGAAEVTLLNVSYDPTGRFYQAFNKAFAASWQQRTGDSLTVRMSHGGSGETHEISGVNVQGVVSGKGGEIPTGPIHARLSGRSNCLLSR